MAAGDSFLAGINTAQRLGLQRQSINIARENMESTRDYYARRNELDEEQQRRLAAPVNAKRRISRLDNPNSPWDFEGLDGFVEGSFSILNPAQYDTDRRFMARAKEAEQFQALDASPLGDLIKKSATVIDSETGQRRPQTEEELAQIYRDRKVTDDTLLSQDPLYQQSDGQEAVTARMKSHTDKVRFMAEYMTDFLGSGPEGDEFVTYYANPDGTYTPMVRPKGSNDDPMPLTEGRSSEGDDPVIKITPEELQRQFETAVQDDIALNGLENPQARNELFNKYGDALAMEEARKSAGAGADLDSAIDPFQGGEGEGSMYHSPSVDEAAIEKVNMGEAKALLRLELLEDIKRRNPEVAPYLAASLVDMTLEELIEVGNNELGEGPVKEMLAALATQQKEMGGYARGSAPMAVRGDNIPDVLYNQGDDYFLQTHEEIPTSDLTFLDATIALATGDTAEAWEYIKANPSVAAEAAMWVLPTGGLLVAGVKGGWSIAGKTFDAIRKKYGDKVADMLVGVWKKTHTVQRQGAGRYGVMNSKGVYMIRHPSQRGVISAAKAKELGMTPNREFSRWRTTQTASLGLAVGEHTRRAIFNESDREKAERYLNNSQTIMRENSNISWVNRVLNPALNDNLEKPEGFPDSTHLLRAEVDELGDHGPVGHWYAFPEIIEENGKLVKLSAKEAFDHAMFQKTAIDFGLEGEEAQRFAEGNYKSQSFLDHFKNRHETEGVLRGAIGEQREVRQEETERQIAEETRVEDLRVAIAEYRLKDFDAVTEAESFMASEEIQTALGDRDATPANVTKVLNELPPQNALAAVWAIVANSSGIDQAKRIALANDLIKGLQTGQIGMSPYDVRGEEREDEQGLRAERQLIINEQTYAANRVDARWDRIMDNRNRLDWRDDFNRLTQSAQLAQKNSDLAHRRFLFDQQREDRNIAKATADVIVPLITDVTDWLINNYNGTPERDADGRDKISRGTNDTKIRSLIDLATNSTGLTTPEIIFAAQNSLAEVLALVIVNEGNEFPQDSILEKIFRRKGDMSIHEISNNLVRTEDGTRIAFKNQGFDVQQGEASVYRLRGILGDGILAGILANLPVEEF